jgi:glutamyl aminopeptidase
MLDFFDKYPEAGAGEGPRNEATEAVKLNIAWMGKHLDTITDWLQGTAEMS